MDDLVAWLRAQLDADERGDGYAHCRGCEDGGVEFMGTMYECDIDTARARVLREVKSKRAIIDQYVEDSDSDHWEARLAADGLGEPVLRLLATVYADRPGYREEWKP